MPARSISIKLPPRPSAVVRNIAALLTSQVAHRCPVTFREGRRAELSIALSLESGLGSEAFRISESAAGSLSIVGNDELGLLYGVGKFLHTSHCDRDGISASRWRGESRPQCRFRAVYTATHFANFYEAAPIAEVQQYVRELALWGANTIIANFPTSQFTGFDDLAARESLFRLRAVFRAAKEIGMRVGLVQCPNQGFSSAPPEIRAKRFPDPLRRRGFAGANCCPSKPRGHEYLIGIFRSLLEEFRDVGLDYLAFWPYDEGGCGCDDCWPWGARGFPRLSREMTAMARKKFPGLKAILSTWMYDTPPEGEWEALAQQLAGDHEWLQYIMADSHTDFPRYPLERGVPGGLPLLNFPEISMWGRAPWGGYGANPLPSRLQHLWEETEGRLQGGMPYSEGIYEDINKVICLGLYWQPDRSAYDNLKEYVAFEYSPRVTDRILQAIRLLEEAWLRPDDRSEEAFHILESVQQELGPQVRRGWRWRILYLRALIDSQALKKDPGRRALLEASRDELIRIYHAENAARCVRPTLPWS